MHFFTELFVDAPLAAQILGALQLAFTLWMFVDAYHRQVESFWFWIILFFQPIGAWGYFFAVKLRTLRLPGLRAAPSFSGERKLSLEQLRFAVERAPTFANRVALAERLMEKKAHAEAIPLLEAALKIESEHCFVLHALAVCRLATDEPEQAHDPLRKLLERDPRWASYLAWRTLIDVHLARGQPADALEACRELAKRQPTLENRCLLAEHLLDNHRPSEVVQLLDEALEEHQFAPWSARWRDGSWARKARRLLTEAEESENKKVDQT